MFPVRFILCFFMVFLSVCLGYAGKYSFAKVESCRGCSLNSLPDVKSFIFKDLPLYNNAEFKPIQGARPVLILYDENEEEMERHPLSDFSREECNQLLISKGFEKRPLKDEI